MTGNGIASITKTGTSGLVDTYTITYTNGNTTTFTITNGEDGEVTETELNVLRQKVANQQKVIDQLPQVEGQGTEVTLENTIEAPFTKFDVEGNSVQDGTPSPDNEVPIYSAGDNENVLDLNDIITTDYITNNGDGSITLNGTGSSGVSFPLKEPFTLKANNTYILSLTNTDSNYSAGTLILRNGNTNIFLINYNVSSVSYTPTQDTVIDTLRIYGGGVTFNNFTFKAKLEKGNKATPYSPYGMGCVNEKVQTRNWFDKNNVIDDYRVGGTGDLFADNGYCVSYPIYVQPNMPLAFNALQGSECICEYDKNGKFLKRTMGNNSQRITTTATTEYVRIAVYKTNKDVFQLEPGTQATSYVPHEEQDYSIPVQQPMRSIGDVRDLFFKNVKESKYYNKDLEENKWYERHYIKYLELLISAMNNSEQYPGWTNVQQIKNDFPNVDTQLITKTLFLCNIFEKTSKIIAINTLGNNSILYLDKSLSNLTQTQWKENYPDLILKLAYISPLPLDLPCTQLQSDILDSLTDTVHTYRGETYISSEDEVKARIKVSGLRDLNVLFNN